MSDATVVGNIGEPQLKYTPSGKAVMEFSLAENHSKKNAQGGWDDDGTTWRRVSIWDKKAEALAEVLKKGDRVIVTGQERIREWESKDGGKGQSLELNARDVGIIPRVQAQPDQGQWGGQQHQGNQWGQQPPAQPQQGQWGQWGGQPSQHQPQNVPQGAPQQSAQQYAQAAANGPAQPNPNDPWANPGPNPNAAAWGTVPNGQNPQDPPF